jgi:hypothetical protein
LQDLGALNRSPDLNDRRKLDEYLTGIRKIETQTEKSERCKLPGATVGERARGPDDPTSPGFRFLEPP